MKPTLGQVFAFSLLGLAVVLALLFSLVFASSRATLLESSERIRARASREIGDRVTSFFAKAPAAVEQFQGKLVRGGCDPHESRSVELALADLLLANSEIGELTFTYGEKLGFNDEGEVQLAPAPRGQMTVARGQATGGREHVWSRYVHQEGTAFVADRREIDPKAPLNAAPQTREAGKEFPDPTLHLTFAIPTRRDLYGQLLPSELHWSQLDADLPETQQRVEASVMQVVTDAAGNFAGVLRVGLLRQQLDRIVAFQMTPEGTADPHRIFIADTEGRLIAPLNPASRIEEFDEGLRITTAGAPPEVLAALAAPKLRTATRETPTISDHFQSGGQEFLATFHRLQDDKEIRDWVVGIVVPRSYYLARLTAIRDQLLLASLAIILLLIAGGALVLRGVKRAQSRIVNESLRMNAFEFSPASADSPFRDVSEVLESLEKAKTAMRAMGKYVPVDLVRRLYCEKSEPALGGQDVEISLMFTDIKDFTTISEELAPNELAAALGRYLEVMARIIQQETRGTIDKYIGDAIMTFWNAPEPVPEHARMACLAALRCRDAGRELAQSPEWHGRPKFETRFGLHRDTALVGHFGAPDRMNYTAIGDAVNLASRLEGLNKQYGTTIIASESIVEPAREHFAFRLLDLVAVKGKSEAIRIYELLGEDGAVRGETVKAYEEAFRAYLARDFAGALHLLERNEADPPSAILAERCRRFLTEPPPADWQGVYLATAK